MLFKPLLKELDGHISTQVISYPKNSSQDYQTLTEYVIKNLPNDEKIILLAESFSGPIAHKLSTYSELKIETIFLVSTFLQYHHFLSRFYRNLPLNFFLNFISSDYLLRKIIFDANTPKSTIKLFRQVVDEIDINTIKMRLTTLIHYIAQNQSIGVPCVYIFPKSDYFVSKKCQDFVSEKCSYIKKYELNGSHFLLQTAPKKCAEIINQEVSLIAKK